MSNNFRIIVVDDNQSVREMLQQYLTELGYSVKSAENGKVALDILDNFEVDVIITDLKMPVLDGDKLIDIVSVRTDAPVMVVLTAHADSDYIVEVMQKGAFDYIVKPIKKNDFKTRIERAVKMSELRRAERITQKEKVVRLEQQLEWHRFHEKLMNKQIETDNAGLFENLHRSLSQGSGIGTMITLFEILLMTAKKNGDHYEIEGDLFEQIKINNSTVNRAISVFSDVDKVATDSINMEILSVLDIYRLLVKIVSNREPKCKIRKNRLILCDSKKGWDSIKLSVNRELIEKALDEIVMNALKYSKVESPITVIFEISDDSFSVSVLNIPRDECKEGIPMEYENLVFEPFFRLVKFIQDDYDTLDYGLGLTYVDRIISRFNGRVRLFNITDFSDLTSSSTSKVSCMVTIPVDKG